MPPITIAQDTTDFIHAEPADTGPGWAVYIYTQEGEVRTLWTNLSELNAVTLVNNVRDTLRSWDGWK